MYKIMILLNNFSSETTRPIYAKFLVGPTVEIGLRVVQMVMLNRLSCPYVIIIIIIINIILLQNQKCSISNDPFISCNDKIGKKNFA